MKQFRDTDYYVTEDGNVYRKWKLGLKKLKPIFDGYGYHKLSIYKNNVPKTFKLHRIVAECYLPNPNDLPEVNHRDGNKINNNISNLYWCTSSHNIKHAFDTGLKIPTRGHDIHCSKLIEEQVIWIRNNYIPRHKKFGCRALAKKFKINSSSISDIINYKSWSHLNPQSDSTNQ